MQRPFLARSPGLSSRPVPAPAAAGHRPLLLAVALATGFAPLSAWPQPTGAQAIVGAATLSQQGNRLVVTTRNGAAGFSAINWQSFSVPGGTSTYFAQPGITSTSINRVVGPDPSAIFGTLGSNGRLVLVNPAGITVGAGAVVDTAGFTASTLRMSDADALAGRLRFEGSGGGPLQVDGQVLARSGDVVLIGSKVQAGATALIQSPQGATVLAAGQKVEVTGRGLEGIVFEVQAPSDQAVNLGTLQGDAVGVFAGTLKHSGLIQAQAVSTEGGRVVLRATGQALVAGGVQAQGMNGAGGSVDVLGTQVGLLAGASIDTSNINGGGQIRIGGDYQGSSAGAPNAQVTVVQSGATLRADATDSGNGGRVIVWADDTTRMQGSIHANAGPRGGDGGFVETSGKHFLDARGARVTATGMMGRAGTWLLDPDDLTIVSGPVPTTAPSVPPENYAGLPPDFTPGALGGASVIYDSTLNAALNALAPTNVTVTTSAAFTSFGSGSGDIILLGGVNLHRDQSGSATLTLNAYNNIRFQGGTTTFETRVPPVPDTLNPPLLQVYLNAGMGGTLLPAPGGVSIASGAGLTTLNSDPAGFIGVYANGPIDNQGALAIGGGTSFSALGLTNSGTLTVDAGSTFYVNAFTQTAGSATFLGGSELNVSGAFDASAGTFDFNGNALRIYQNTGTLTIANNGVTGGAITATGPIVLSASDGDVVVNRAIQSAGNVSISAISASSPPVNGSIQLNAAVSADKLMLNAAGQDNAGFAITQKAPIDANELMVLSGVGKTDLTNPGNTVRALAVSSPSFDLVNNADDLVIKPLSNNQTETSLAGLQGGAVRITNHAASPASPPNSGSVTIDGASTVSVDSLSITADGSIASAAAMQTSGRYDTTVPKLGDIDLTAGGSITFTAIDTNSGAKGSMGSAGGAVSLIARTGISGVSIDASGRPSGGNLPGNPGGIVRMSSKTGDIAMSSSIRSSGDGAGGQGGDVSISAASGSILLADIEVPGGGSASGPGGNGGTVSVDAGTGVTVASIAAWGGDGGAGAVSGDRGGNGGPVSIKLGSGDLHLEGTNIDVGGGGGGADARLGGTGGDGGNVVLTAAAGGVFMNAGDPNLLTPGTMISTGGGMGGNTTGTATTDRGGAGGAGGTIQIVATGNSQMLGTLISRGGDGGYAPGLGSLAVGGAGGPGGPMFVTLTAPAATLTLGGALHAGGSVGGQAADFDPTLVAWTNIDPSRAGAAGMTSAFSASVPGAVFVPAALGVPSLDPSSGDASASLNMVARWTATGTLVLDPGAWLRSTESFTNNGTVKLGSGSLLSLGRYDQTLQTFLPGGVSFVNGSTGLLQGAGTLQANVLNAGTLSPGDANGGLGALTVAGDLALQPTSKLLLDVSPNAAPIAGVNYDQLVVLGNLTLGGQLQVNALPTTAALAASTAPGAVARQMFASTGPNLYVLISAGSVSTGSTFATATAPLDVQPLAMLNDAGVLRPLFPMSALPAAPLQPQIPNDMLTFLTMFTQQTLLPAAPLFDENGKPKGRPDIVSTDGGTCRPV